MPLEMQYELLSFTSKNILVTSPNFKKNRKIDSKYHWLIGEAPPTLDQHSKVKHQIIGEYVKQYVAKLMSNVLRPEMKMALVDGFCGGGLYQGENNLLHHGSPIIAMQAISEARVRLNLDMRKQRIVDARYFFIDVLPDTTDYLKLTLKQSVESGVISKYDYDRVEVITGNFIQQLQILSNKIYSYGCSSSIFILDQYSYKDVPMRAIRSILANIPKAEVILTFNVENLVTYLSNHKNNEVAVSNVDLHKYVPWDQLKQLKVNYSHGGQWRKIIQKPIGYGIKNESGAEYMTLFFIKPSKSNSWGYWLIHLSNNYTAHSVMKNIHWQYANNFSHDLDAGVYSLGYYTDSDLEYTGKSSLFDNNLKERCIEELQLELGKQVHERGAISLENLFKENIGYSTGADSHFQTVARHLHSTKNFIITTKDGSKRKPSKSYNKDDVIEPVPQIILI